MASRPWSWLRTHIEGLMTCDSRLARYFATPPTPEPAPQEVDDAT